MAELESSRSGRHDHEQRATGQRESSAGKRSAGKRSFLAEVFGALRLLMGDSGVAMLLLGGPFIYSFFYPWFYSAQVPLNVPVALVVQDQSNLSRQIERFAQANPRIDVTLVTGDESRAKDALLRQEILGYALLPKDLKRHVVRSEEAVIPVYGNGGYPLAAKQVQIGFSETIGTVSAGIEIGRLSAEGQSALQAASSRAPVSVVLEALFNPTEGSGSFVVAAVAILILQQTLLMGGAMMVATLREQGQANAGTTTWLARLLALCLVGWLSGLYYFGWMFVIQDIPRGGNPLGQLALLAVFTPAVAGFAVLIGWWLADRERVMYSLLFISLPCAFLGGFTWPAEALPDLLQSLRWLVPSTAGIQASLRVSQTGAQLQAAAFYLSVLLSLALVTWLAFLALARGRFSK